MWFWFFMLGVNLMFPAVMLVEGKLFLKRPPKKMNFLYGYRTTMSMKNEDTWRFAHAVAGKFWWNWGWINFAIAIVPMFFIIGKPIDVVGSVSAVVICLLMIPLIAVVPHTEKALQSTFDKDGNRKADGSCNM